MKTGKLSQLHASQRSTEDNVSVAEKQQQISSWHFLPNNFEIYVLSLYFFSLLELTKLFSFWIDTYSIGPFWSPKNLKNLVTLPGG